MEATKNDTDAHVDFLLKAVPYIAQYGVIHNHNKTEQESTKEFKKESIHQQSLQQDLDSLVKRKEVAEELSKSVLFEEYMINVENDPSVMCKRTHQYSPFCCGVPCVFNKQESDMICMECGAAYYHQDIHVSNMTFDQEQSVGVPSNAVYKRSHHLMEHLAAFQGVNSGNQEVPEEVLEMIRQDFKKNRVTVDKINSHKVRAAIKKLRLGSKNYEFVADITHRLSGKPPPTLSWDMTDRILTMFYETQKAFDKVCPKTKRKSFLSYPFVIRNILNLLGENKIAEEFPLIASREKLSFQQSIWRDICKELQWEYIPVM
jgi:hypothetical protein